MGEQLFALFKAGAVLVAGALLVACLDIPSDPKTSSKISDVTILLKQNGFTDSTILKASSTDSSALEAKVHPSTYQDDVLYYWYNDDEVLDSGRHYTISAVIAQSGKFTDLFVPNRLIVKDSEGNTIEKDFKVIINAPPTLSKETKPADGDTLYGNEHTPFLFSWDSQDNDQDQLLEHTLEIDSVSYSVGDFLQVMQSGLSQGSHSFRVIVTDSYGDRDSTSRRTFFVVDTTGGIS